MYIQDLNMELSFSSFFNLIKFTLNDLWWPLTTLHMAKESDRRSKLVDLGIFEDISMVVAISLSGRARSKKSFF